MEILSGFKIVLLVANIVLPVFIFFLSAINRPLAKKYVVLFDRLAFSHFTIDELFVKRFQYMVAKANNAEDANNIRKWYNQEFLFIIGVEIILYIFLFDFSSIIIVCYLMNKYISLRASYGTMLDIDRESDYVLYLRGFETDFYYNDKGANPVYAILKNSIFRYDYFNEKLLSKVLKEKVKFYGIGMTKEVASPNGASRIYMDDDCWKENVLKMMQDCGAIVILLHSKRNCIWEFEHALPFKEKVYCVSYDQNMYKEVLQSMKGKIELTPEVPEDHFWFKLASDTSVYPLNSEDDYVLFGKELIKTIRSVES